MEVLGDADVAREGVGHPHVERYARQISMHITRQVRCVHSVLRRCMEGDVEHALRIYRKADMSSVDDGWWFLSLVRGTVPFVLVCFFILLTFEYFNSCTQ